MTDRKRIAITGIGLATAFGDLEATWRGLTSNASAIRVWDESADDHLGAPLSPRVGVRPWLRTLASAAIADARLLDRLVERDRVGVAVGLSKGDWAGLTRHAQSFAWTSDAQRSGDADTDWGQDWLNCWPHGGAGAIASAYDFRGPCLAPVAACASGVVAVMQAAELIRSGRCDVALAGAADASLEPMLLAAFRRMRVLARESDPQRAVRPWDRDRSGFVVGEGGAILVLEDADRAKAAGIVPWAEFAGGALGSDGHHETSLNPDPANLAALIGRALRDARMSSAEIDHVNLHGSATRDNDPLECRALRRAFGADAERLVCSANKSQIGHLLGAAGAVELAIACLSLRRGFVPPTLNLDCPDPACDLDATPHYGRALSIQGALKLSLGFGGHFAAAALRKWGE